MAKKEKNICGVEQQEQRKELCSKATQEQKRKENEKAIFGKYKNVDVLYRTKDELYFIQKSDAINHARQRGDGGIEEVRREKIGN